MTREQQREAPGLVESRYQTWECSASVSWNSHYWSQQEVKSDVSRLFLSFEKETVGEEAAEDNRKGRQRQNMAARPSVQKVHALSFNVSLLRCVENHWKCQRQHLYTIFPNKVQPKTCYLCVHVSVQEIHKWYPLQRGATMIDQPIDPTWPQNNMSPFSTISSRICLLRISCYFGWVFSPQNVRFHCRSSWSILGQEPHRNSSSRLALSMVNTSWWHHKLQCCVLVVRHFWQRKQHQGRRLTRKELKWVRWFPIAPWNLQSPNVVILIK